jgi:hypothetical protein
MDGGLVADGELVEVGRYRAATLKPADPTFDRVAVLVAFGVEGQPRARTAVPGRPIGGIPEGR